MSNIGRVITDIYCNGYADREYDMYGAIIISEGDSWIVCRKENGRNVFIDFQIFDWNRNENRSLAGGISNLRTDKDMQDMIDSWCA